MHVISVHMCVGTCVRVRALVCVKVISGRKHSLRITLTH